MSEHDDSTNPYRAPEADLVRPEETLESGRAADAPRRDRFFGALADGIAGFLIVMLVYLIAGKLDDLFNSNIDIVSSIALSGLSFLVWLVPQGYLLATRGQTIGKILVGTQIVSFEDDRLVSIWKLIGLRILPLNIIGMVPCLGALASLADVLFIFRDDHRCVHDHLAGTRVIRYRPI